MEEHLLNLLPRWLFKIIACIHDTLPWSKGEWEADEYGNVR